MIMKDRQTLTGRICYYTWSKQKSCIWISSVKGCKRVFQSTNSCAYWKSTQKIDMTSLYHSGMIVQSHQRRSIQQKLCVCECACVCACVYVGVCNTSDIAWGSVFSRGPQSQSELGPNEQTRRLTNYWWHVSSRLISWLLHVKWLWFCCSEVTGQIRRSTKTELTASTVNALIIRRIQHGRRRERWREKQRDRESEKSGGRKRYRWERERDRKRERERGLRRESNTEK